MARIHDTLIAHHTFASHLPQKMDQVVSEFLDSEPWKITFGRRGAEEKGLAPHMMPPRELYMYNAGDTWRQIDLWNAIQADLARERDVYEHDLKLARIAKDMQVRGFAVDVARKAEVRQQLSSGSFRLKSLMRRITGKGDFTPAKLDEVRWAIYRKLKAPVLTVTSTGMPSTSQASVQSFAAGDSKLAQFCQALLQWRGFQKIRGTYLDAIDVDDGPLGPRSHFNWRVYGTVSGRWSCRMQSVPRYKDPKKGGTPDERVREIYVASPGQELIYFDLKQSEMRAAAFLSGDAKFIANCAIDIHVGNAQILFPKHADRIANHKNDPVGKECRDIAKNAGFGVLYSAEIKTIFEFLRGKGFNVSFIDVATMFDKIHREYATYYRYCEQNLLQCHRHGFMRTALMKRIRWIGWHPQPGDAYNFAVQSFIADLMNLRMIELEKRKPKGAHILGQYHDALICEAPKGKTADALFAGIQALWDEPVLLPGTERTMVFPIDLKRGHRWSEF